MSKELLSGQWDSISLRDQGPISLTLISAVPARLEVSGAARPPRYLGGARTDVVLPAGSVPEDALVSVYALTASGEAFPGDGAVDLTVDMQSPSHSYFLRGNPVAGHVSAPLLQLSRDGEVIVVRPGEGGTATYGLGGWCTRRRQERGEPVRLTVTQVLVDSSSSMRRMQDRVEALCEFLRTMSDALGAPAPRVLRVGVGGAEENGVGGLIAPVSTDGRRIVVTDLPLVPGNGECLLVSPPGVLDAMPMPGALALSDKAWAELVRDDTTYDMSTLEALTPLLDWLTQPLTAHGGAV